MSSVTPPPPPSPPAIPPPPAPSVVVQQPPPALLSLDIGAKLEARLAGIDGQGRILIESPVGKLAVQTTTALPANGPVQLQVQSLGSQVVLLITALHGKPPVAALRALTGLLPPTLPGLGANPGSPARGLGAAGQPGTAGITQGRGLAGTAPVQLTEGTTLRATLLRPATALPGTGSGASAGANPSAAPNAGNPATATAGGRIANAAGRISGVHRTGATGPATAPSASAGSAIQLPAGTIFTVRALNVQPGTPQPAPPTIAPTMPLSPGLQLVGTVSTSGAPGQTIVQTHAGPVSLATAMALPPGTRVTLEIVDLPRPTPPTENAAMHRRLGQAILQSHQWPALDEAVDTLAELNPTMAQQLVNAVLPRADHTLAANLLFFLFALRGGDLRQWLGDAPARALERLKPALLGRLRDDFSGLARLAEEPPSGDGRVLPIPLVHGAEIEQVRLWLRRRDEEDSDEDDQRSGPGTRFVVDLTLSRLGRLQLDGFVKDGSKRFDLIVRSERKLTAEVANGIREIFEGANEISGVSGGLAFQAAPPGFVDTERPAADGGLGLVV